MHAYGEISKNSTIKNLKKGDMNMRTYLEKGTILQLDILDYYMITCDAPIGEGGGGILYSASRLSYDAKNDSFRIINNIDYALKECFPVSKSKSYSYTRNKYGEVIPETDTEDSRQYLEISKKMQLSEQDISSEIYKKGFRITPVLFASRHCRISRDHGKTFCDSSNVFTVMESLHEKGTSLQNLLSKQKNVSFIQALSIVRQTLYALNEVHAAGYLYLDIQTGNIFVKGNLNGNNEFITLIDFGSARRVLKDGKTDPIEDRVLFSTEGFSAPEMHLHNDGTLRLDCRADLYSVGYLLLLLITGKKYTSKDIINTKNGNYISGFRQKKLECPKHLLPFLKTILVRSLCTEPSERYASAEEMLSDVEQLVNALSPAKSSLYSVSYDAFISYRHNETDSKVAMKLQQELEHLRVPKGVTTKPGHKPIQRVFVDEGELSSCADLGMQIREALKNSEYLIVICSPATPDSPWVNSEIETFLEYHDRSHILAVLTDGEPDVSFPKLLKKGKGHDEALAADARGANTAECLKRMKKEALFRVAAPILGTTYDTLKQRRQNYVMKRIAFTAVFATLILAGFLSFSLWQTAQIKKQYTESRKNQAKVLAAESIASYEKGDITKALELALTVLPEDDTNEALVPEQRYALNKIVAANNGNSAFYYPYKDLWEEAFSQGSLSSDKKLYVGLNEENEAVFLDPLTGDIINRIAVFDIPQTVSSKWIYAYAIDANTAILYGKHDIIGIRIDTNEVIAQLSNTGISFSFDNYTPAIFNGNELKTAVYSNEKGIIVYNLTKNSMEDQISISHYLSSSDKSFLDFSTSAETLYIGLPSAGEYEHGGLLAYSMKSHQLSSISSDSVAFMKCISKKQLAVIQCNDEGMDYSSASWVSLRTHTYRVCIYDIDTMSCSFTKEIGIYSNVTCGGLYTDILLSDQKQDFKAFVFWVGPSLLIYNLDNQKIYQEYAFETYVADAAVENNAVLLIALQDGSARITLIHESEVTNPVMLYKLDTDIEKITYFSDNATIMLQTPKKLLWLTQNIDSSLTTIDYPDSEIASIGHCSIGDENFRIVGIGNIEQIQGFDVYKTGSDECMFHYMLTGQEYNDKTTIHDISIKQETNHHMVVSFYVTYSKWNALTIEEDESLCIFYQIDMETNDVLKRIDISSYGKYLNNFYDGGYDDQHERLYFIRDNGGFVYFDFLENQAVPCENAILPDKDVKNLFLTGDGNYIIITACESNTLSQTSYSVWVYDVHSQNSYNTELIYDYSSTETENSFQLQLIPGESASVFSIYDGRHTIDIYDCQKKSLLSSIPVTWDNEHYIRFRFFNQDQLLITADPDRISLYECNSGTQICSVSPDILVGNALQFPYINISASADSNYFSVQSLGESIVTLDGALLDKPLYIYEYDNTQKAIHRVCDIKYGIFDPDSLEIINWISDNQIHYSRLHSFHELVDMAKTLYSSSISSE